MALPQASHAAPLVLVVDQSRSIGTLLHALLANAGYRCLWLPPAYPGRVLRVAATLRPAAVHLDGSAGHRFGRSWTLAADLRAQNPDLPVLLFTTDWHAIAAAEAEQHHDSGAARFRAIVPKPFEIDALLAMVAHVPHEAPVVP
jgi:DNA-binding response OmpR family regulator